MNATERAREELRGAAFTPLWTAARRAMERTGGRLDASFTLGARTPAEEAAVRGLLGRVPKRMTLAALDDAVRTATGVDLRALLEGLGGPLRDRPAERAARVERRSEVVAGLRAHPIATEPWFDCWLDEITSDGLLAVAQRRGVLGAALDIVDVALRGTGSERSLASLVAGATGDTKQLTSTTVRSLVERALALAAGVARPTTSLDRRLLWRGFGVTLDDVSSDVLVLNVRTSGTDRVARWLGDAADAGEPFRLTLRQLASSNLTIDEPALWICENPAVVMDVATRLGARSAPLVCTEGVPTDACWTLLDRLAPRCDVRVRADFDAAGLGIAAAVLARTSGTAWRFDTATYRRALTELGDRVRLPRSRGRVPPSPWDPPLADALATDGRAVFEELLIDELVADLDAGYVLPREDHAAFVRSVVDDPDLATS